MSRKSPPRSIAAQNFLSVLRLIDRTIIPRLIVLNNSKTTLKLVVARQRASVKNRSGEISSAQDLLAAILTLCTEDLPITYRLEAIPEPDSIENAHTAAAIVNAQSQSDDAFADELAKAYSFTRNGWILSAPPDCAYASLDAAARIATKAAGWAKLDDQGSNNPPLILVISDHLPDERTVSVEGAVTITATPPSLLGKLVSQWRSQSYKDG
ncbi:MAG: hypothetical protein KTR19_11330 [Hyphomicrobiales bacterium]|nr:hypothetical protein [Hyphomicrobiales bacterium]